MTFLEGGTLITHSAFVMYIIYIWKISSESSDTPARKCQSKTRLSGRGELVSKTCQVFIAVFLEV